MALRRSRNQRTTDVAGRPSGAKLFPLPTLDLLEPIDIQRVLVAPQGFLGLDQTGDANDRYSEIAQLEEISFHAGFREHHCRNAREDMDPLRWFTS
jgi:hypothetical protein